MLYWLLPIKTRWISHKHIHGPWPPSHSTPQRTPLGHHRAAGWAPCITQQPPLAGYFTYGHMHTALLPAQYVPPSPSSTVSAINFEYWNQRLFEGPFHLLSFNDISVMVYPLFSLKTSDFSTHFIKVNSKVNCGLCWLWCCNAAHLQLKKKKGIMYHSVNNDY